MNKKTLTVYVCSPYAGDVALNVKNARRYARYVVERNATPIAPHLLFPQFLNDAIPEERQTALAMGLELLNFCNELWVFGSVISEGMRGEIDYAEYWGKPVKYFTADCEATVAPVEELRTGSADDEEDIPF